MNASRRWAAVALAATAITALAAGAPGALRRMDGFTVRQVEVRGTRLLDPATAIAASAIAPDATVFDDFEPWRDALLAHPLVLDARVARRLPDTIVLDVTEATPVALARTPELRPVDRRGQVLPVAPDAGLDLPVLAGPAPADGAGMLVGEAQRALVAALADATDLQPELADWISEVHAAGRDGMRLLLRWPAGAEILLPLEVDAARMRELALVLADLAAAQAATPDAQAEIHRLRRLDARFHDQVVVSLTEAPTASTQPSNR